MREEETKLYTSVDTYLQAPDRMRNEVDMWAAAGGLLVQESVKRNINSRYGGLHEKVGIKVRKFTPVTVLDICCGHGNFANYLSLFHPNMLVMEIDLNDRFLAYAQKTFGKYDWNFLKEDATAFSLGRSFDFITASSAYYHILDEKKVDFLRRINEHLGEDGKLIMCDHFLPRCEKKSDREISVNRYYHALEEYYALGNATPEAQDAIKEVRELELAGVSEQKVDYQRFLEHLRSADLKIELDRVVWQPSDFLESNAGSHALLIQRA